MTAPWPEEVRLAKNRDQVIVTWDDRRVDQLPAEYLRVESPSAEVQGHGPGQRKLVAGKRDVRIDHVQPTGNYAVKLTFNDGHASGIFTWNYLRQLADEHDTRWADYMARLEAVGSRRDP